MHEACPNPCSQCPFKRGSLPGWLGEWSGPEELSAHVLAGNRYPCHMTMNEASHYDDMGIEEELIDDLILVDSTQCKGSMMYRERFNLERQGAIITSNYFSILSHIGFMLHHKGLIK